ncbi:M14 family metallopeptidase [Salegentibacter sp. F188]|uniref:M14 family metallopeptidase n=1 Tax=Autumnicola patrickiae TaxID=3075591 RepID=A0ABU3DXJ1_9FLAO|nr:M14 family metallopeptidase [Salegentibacter sp. F188]MDT0688425.1 M14 family metallopeptidase [Salegentibacter sp. F188]
MKKLFPLFTFLLLSLPFLNAQQSPADFLGYEAGEEFSRHADVVEYFEHVAENSPLVQYHTYGETYERRTLTYAIVSSEENLQNLENIRRNHLNNAGLLDGQNNADNQKAIVWLSYNVHGNEASSTEAAMATLYSLITENRDLLENTVVIIDPSVNPDGRDRYVNWYNQVEATPFNTAQSATEHHEPWPGGRPNHYLFDLNRDWAWATQKETRQRLKIYNQWMPHIHVDFHEQGINEPYYFAPAAEPFHEVITPFQREFQTKIGKNNAEYFDEEGWLFFTKESFDLLYPSYGDTYPTYLGAIGMTFEQAGHGRAGLGIETDEGEILTLKDRIIHHFTTGISTVEVASQNIEDLNNEFKKFFSNNEEFEYQSYALRGNPDKIVAVKQLLDQHEITYSNAANQRIKGYDYSSKMSTTSNATEETLVVSSNQPKGKMVKVLFEPATKLADSLTYDITAWSLPYAYGLEAIASPRSISTANNITEKEIENVANPSGAGYISKWNSMQDARFLAALLKEDIRVRFSEIPFESEGQQFDRGSLIITKSDNRNTENFDEKVVEIANRLNRQLLTAKSSFAGSGPDFGSPDVKLVNPQRIAVLKGDDISSLNYGEIWHFFEQDLNYPITRIDTDYFQRIDLSQFDVLVMPEGYYEDVFTEAVLEDVTDWVRHGGKLIAIGEAAGYFSGRDDFQLEENKVEKPADSAKTGNLIPYNQRERESIKDLITGSIIKTKVDNTHPMAFGYKESYFSLKLNSDSYSLLKEGYNVAYIQDPEIVSGFAGGEAQKNLKNSVVFGEERLGSGSIIYLVDNPLFRSFWENGKLFFVNSLFFVNN